MTDHEREQPPDSADAYEPPGVEHGAENQRADAHDQQDVLEQAQEQHHPLVSHEIPRPAQ